MYLISNLLLITFEQQAFSPPCKTGMSTRRWALIDIQDKTVVFSEVSLEIYRWEELEQT